MDILNNPYITYDCIRTSVVASDKEKDDFCVEFGDILFQRSSETLEDVGRANVYLDSRPALFGGFTIRGKKKGNYNPLFFKYLLDSPAARKRVIVKGAGAQHFNIGQEGLSKVTLSFPSLAEQSKISILLSTLDKRIAIQNKLIQRYESLIKALNQRHFRRVRVDETLNYVNLSNILHERREYCENDGTYPHASLSKDGVDVKTDRFDRDFLVRDDEKKYKVTRLNDICYNPANLKFGVITRNKKGTFIFSPIYVTFHVSNRCDPEYIEYYLTEPDFIRKMLRFEQGTVYERMAVSPEDFLSERIRIPDKRCQAKHAHLISEVTRYLDSERRLLTNWLCVKRYILSEMFI